MENVIDILRHKKVFVAQLGTLAAQWKDPNGEAYVTLCSGGIKPEGATTPAYATPQEAWDRYRERLSEMVTEFDHVYFRALPVLEGREDGFVVRSRLSVA